MRPPAPSDKTVALDFYEGILAEMSARVSQRAEQFRGCARIGELYAKQVGHDETCPARGRGADTSTCDCLCAQIPNADPANLAGHLLDARAWIRKYKDEREQTERAHRAAVERLEAALKHYAVALEKARESVAAVQGHEPGCDHDDLGECACFFTTGAAGVTGLGEVAANALAKLRVQERRPREQPALPASSAMKAYRPTGCEDRPIGMIRAIADRMGIAGRIAFEWETREGRDNPYARVYVRLSGFAAPIQVNYGSSSLEAAFSGLTARFQDIEHRFKTADLGDDMEARIAVAFVEYIPPAREVRTEAKGRAWLVRIEEIELEIARLGLTAGEYTIDWSDIVEPPFVSVELRFVEIEEPLTLRLTAFTTTIPTLDDAFGQMCRTVSGYADAFAAEARLGRSRESALWTAFEAIIPPHTADPEGFTPRLTVGIGHEEMERYPALHEIGRRVGQLRLPDKNSALTYGKHGLSYRACLTLRFPEFNEPVEFLESGATTEDALNALRDAVTPAVREFVTGLRIGQTREAALWFAFQAFLPVSTNPPAKVSQ